MREPATPKKGEKVPGAKSDGNGVRSGQGTSSRAAGKGMRAPSRKTVPRKNASTGPSPTVHAKAKPKTTQTQQAVAAELDHLRMILREISTLFADRLESEIVQIHEAVLSCPRSPTRRPALSKMRGLLSRLSIRPEKGRRKDLKRIDRLVAELNKIARTL